MVVVRVWSSRCVGCVIRTRTVGQHRGHSRSRASRTTPGHDRSANVPAQQFSWAIIEGPLIAAVLSDAERSRF